MYIYAHKQVLFVVSIPNNYSVPLRKNTTNHQVTTMLATSKNVLYPSHNHLLTTGAEDLTLYRLSSSEWRVISTSG